jgi:hypothetical protein
MRIVSRPPCGTHFRFTASWAMSRTLQPTLPSGGGCTPGRGSAGSDPRPVPAACPDAPSHPTPAPVPPPRSPGPWPALSWEPRPRGRPPAPPSVPGQAGAGSRLPAAPARTPALCSASRRSASDPSSQAGHAPDGNFACPHCATHFVTPKAS